MIEVLESLGLTRNESKAYLSLLELGFTSAGQVAKRAKLDRANTYDSLEKLKTKGLVGYSLKKGVAHYEASNPSQLKTMLHEKEEQLSAIIPQLELAKMMGKSKSVVGVHEGIHALMDIMNGLLANDQPIFFLGFSACAVEHLKYSFSHFDSKRISEKVPMLILCNQDVGDKMPNMDSSLYVDIGYLQSGFESKVSTIICGDETVIVTWDKIPKIIRISHSGIASFNKENFKVLWMQAV